MPSDQTGLVKPPAGSGLSLGGDSGGGAPSGKPPLTKNQKYAIGGISFVVLALGVYWYSKHKSSSASATGTTTTAPEVIQPSSDSPASNQDTMPASTTTPWWQNLSGAGATDIATGKTNHHLGITGSAPVPGNRDAINPSSTPSTVTPSPTQPEISSSQLYPSNYIFANPDTLNVSNPTVNPASEGGTSYNPPAPTLPAGETSGEYYSIPGDPY